MWTQPTPLTSTFATQLASNFATANNLNLNFQVDTYFSQTKIITSQSIKQQYFYSTSLLPSYLSSLSFQVPQPWSYLVFKDKKSSSLAVRALCLRLTNYIQDYQQLLRQADPNKYILLSNEFVNPTFYGLFDFYTFPLPIQVSL